MLKLIIEDDEGRRTVVPFQRDEITIGRQEGNTIRLTERNVSRKHARLVRQNGHVVVEDLGSYNGIRVNGHRIAQRTPIHDGDLIQIGDYGLAIESDATRANEPSTGPLATEIVPAAEASSTAPTQLAIPVPPALPKPPALPIEVAPEDAPRLFVLNTDLSGREFACIRPELLIGSSEDSDICINHPSVSRVHAKLFRSPENGWQLTDLESTTGVMVNGKRQSQAQLASNDLIDIGEVKLKFLGPGDLATPPPRRRKRGGKKWLALALVFVTAGWAGSKFAPPYIRVGLQRLTALAQAPVEPVVSVDPPPPTEPVAAAAAPGPESPAAPESLPIDNEAANSAQAEEELLQKAHAALDAQDFEGAVSLLHASSNPEAQSLLKEAEAALKKKTLMTRRENRASRNHSPDAASASVAPAQAPTAEPEPLAGRVPKEKKRATGDHLPAVAGDSSSAKKYYEQGANLLRNSQLKEAEASFNRCLDVDPGYSRCYMLLGSTLARNGRNEEAARYYRMFIQMSPSDPLTHKIRDYLDTYEASKK